MTDTSYKSPPVSPEVEESNLKELIRKRGFIKAKVTNFKKFLTTSKVREPKQLTAEQLIDLEFRAERMKSVLTEFELYQNQIETICSNVEEQALEREVFENSYFESLAQAETALRSRTVKSDTSKPEINKQIPPAEAADSIKYPEIILPTFNGDVTQWIEFRDTFDALINQGNLKSIQKYKYLRSCLKGSALEVVGALEYSEESYAIAWQLLLERYNNPKILVSNHLRALFGIDSVPNTSRALRGLADNISKHLRTLRSLNIDTGNWDILVIFFLNAKLDRGLLRKWDEKTNSRELPTLQEYKTFLRNQADLLEVSAGPATAATSGYTPSRPSGTWNHNNQHKVLCAAVAGAGGEVYQNTSRERRAISYHQPHRVLSVDELESIAAWKRSHWKNMQFILQNESPKGMSECCPSVVEMVAPKGGRTPAGLFVDLFEDGVYKQQLYELSCAPGVAEQPCRFIDSRLYNQSKCVQKYSYSYALVRKPDPYGTDLPPLRHKREGHFSVPGGWSMDYITVRAGCECQINQINLSVKPKNQRKKKLERHNKQKKRTRKHEEDDDT